MDWTPFSFIDRVLTVCEAAPVLGRPRYLARFVEQGLCRVRWLAAAVIPFWIATIFLHLWFAQEAPDVVAGMGGGALGPRLAVILPLVLAVAGAAATHHEGPAFTTTRAVGAGRTSNPVSSPAGPSKRSVSTASSA